MIDEIGIDLWSSINFASLEDRRRKCNSMTDLSKFTFNKKILSRVVIISYNQVCCQILFLWELVCLSCFQIFIHKAKCLVVKLNGDA